METNEETRKAEKKENVLRQINQEIVKAEKGLSICTLAHTRNFYKGKIEALKVSFEIVRIS